MTSRSTGFCPTSLTTRSAALVDSLAGSSNPPLTMAPKTPVPQTPPTIMSTAPAASTHHLTRTTVRPHHANIAVSP
jgi:hypothetical protein